MCSTKVLLIMMVKNESKIIERAINSTIPIIDGLCVLDTGSTDNTVEIANRIIGEHKARNPDFIGKVYSEPFINFGESRTRSFEVTRELLKENEWNLDTTYGLLLDADMVLRMDKPEKVKQRIENCDTGMLFQIQSPYKYFNVRFIRMSKAWVCVGVTHEYWTAPDAEKTIVFENNIWIDDISDGGCKSDKFERDARMLLDGVKKEPENARYYFYLGQTYMCLNNPQKSIEYYTKSTFFPMAAETHWFSLCMISKQYILLEKIKEAEEYCEMAVVLKPNRSEPLYEMAAYYLSVNNLEKVDEYVKRGVDIPLPERDVIYVDGIIYGYGFKMVELESMIRRREMFTKEELIEKFNKIRDANMHGKKVFMDDLLWKFADKIQVEHSLILDKLFTRVGTGCMLYDNDNNNHILFSKDTKTVTTLKITETTTETTVEKISTKEVSSDIDCLFKHNGEVWFKKENGVLGKLKDGLVSEITDLVKFLNNDQPPIVNAFQRLIPLVGTKTKTISNSNSNSAEHNIVGLLQTILPTMLPKTTRSLFMIARRTPSVFEYTAPFYFENINTEETCESICEYDDNGRFLIVYTSSGVQKVAIVKPDFLKMK